MRRGAGAVAIALLTALAVAGCPFSPHRCEGDDCGGGGSDFRARTTPANVLYNLQKAYEKRSTAEFESLLATNFVFVLSPEDQQKPDMPDQWGRDQEIQIHSHMFDNELVQTLTLAFEPGDPVWDPANGLYMVRIINVNLYLDGATPAHPSDVKEYRVTGGHAKFWFRKNPWFAADTRDSVWTIVQWADDPID
jgi:hypothetical protein